MKLLKRYGKKLKILQRTIKLVYKQSPKAAPMRDLLFILITGLEMYQIKLGGQFIDETIKLLDKWDTFSFIEYFQTESFYIFAISLAVWMLNSAFGKTRNYLKDLIKENTFLKIDRSVLGKISYANLQDVETKEFRDLLSLTEKFSYTRIFDTYNAFSELLRHLIRSVSSIIILFTMVGPSALLLVLFAIPETILGHYNRKKIRKYRDGAVEQAKYTSYLWNIATRIPLFSELRVDGTFKYLKKMYNKEAGEYADGYLKENKHYFIDTALFSVTGQLMKYGYIIYILAISIAKKVSIGTFKAMYDYANTAYGSAFHALNKMFQISNHIEYARYYFDYKDYKGFGDLEHGDQRIPKGVPELRFENIDFVYPDGEKKVIEDISFKVKPGEKVAFIGGDGSGKSTLLRILCGLYAVKIGDYQIGNYSIRELDRGELKNRISVIFQDFVRYNMTIKENIVVSGEKERINKSLYERVKEVSDVKEFMKTEGVKDSQMLGKYFAGGRELSPGYWQRIAIARMLYRNRDVFIMDEPFTYIDGHSRVKIMDSIFDFLGKDKTLIYITQDTDHLNKFDRIFYLKGGKIVESGTEKELVKKKGEFYKETKFNK